MTRARDEFKKMYPTVSDEMIDKALNHPKEVAEWLTSVQPMDTPEVKEALQSLFTTSKSEKELIAEGFEPVCKDTRLMWVKKREA